MTEGNTRHFQMAVGTSTMLESGMMEGENFYAPIESANETETASQNNWSGGKPPDTGQLCRSCANASDYLIPIYEGEGLEHQLEYKIQKYLPIQVSTTDTLPLQLCYQCASTLIAWDTMISSCLEAEKKLKAIQEAAEESRNRELFGDSQPDGETEMIDSDDEPLIASKSKILSENSKSAPLKKKILSKTKSKSFTISNEKTATNSKEDEGKERMSFPEEFEIDVILENELNSLSKTMSPSRRESSAKGVGSKAEEKAKRRLLPSKQGRSSKSKKDLSCLVDEKDVDSIIQEANRLRGMKVVSGGGAKAAGSTPYVECPFCQKVVEKKAASEHMSKEHNLVPRAAEKVDCHLCGKVFSGKNFLQRHIHSVHEKVVRAECEVCKRTFTDMSNYKRHVLIHTGVKSYVCQVCGKAFAQPQGLRMHMPSHSDSYPYSCGQCSKQFRRKQHYDLHLLKHSGKKPHQCETCGKFFAAKNELKMHSWIHKEEWPHTCQHCNKGFNQSFGLKLHLKNHHALPGQYSVIKFVKSSE